VPFIGPRGGAEAAGHYEPFRELIGGVVGSDEG
jgi:hypothetical protein